MIGTAVLNFTFRYKQLGEQFVAGTLEDHDLLLHHGVLVLVEEPLALVLHGVREVFDEAGRL